MGQRKAPCAFEPHVKEILHPVRGAGRSHLHRHHRAHQGHFDLQAREGRAPCDLRRPLRRECYTIAAEQSAFEVAERVSFEAKWHLLARVGVRCYILISNVSGAVKVAPLQILQFPVVLPHKFQDAERFNLQFSDFSEISETADKLRWLRYQKGLRQRDVADYAGIDRSTYVHYDESKKRLEVIYQRD